MTKVRMQSYFGCRSVALGQPRIYLRVVRPPVKAGISRCAYPEPQNTFSPTTVAPAITDEPAAKLQMVLPSVASNASMVGAVAASVPLNDADQCLGRIEMVREHSHIQQGCLSSSAAALLRQRHSGAERKHRRCCYELLHKECPLGCKCSTVRLKAGFSAADRQSETIKNVNLLGDG
jgi:hypothetical protein